MQLKQQFRNFFSHFFVHSNNIHKKFEPIVQVVQEQSLWNNKPIKEDSILLWDLENIGFNRLSDIKRVVKYTPETCYVVTTQKLSNTKREQIESEYFTILDAHKTISDEKIISLMKLYKNKKDMILISSDADFAREANKYLKNNRLHWIVSEQSKKRVTMSVKLDSPHLTLSAIPAIPAKKKLITLNKRRFFKQSQPVKYKLENRYGVKTYWIYYQGRVKNFLQKIKSVLKKQETISQVQQYTQKQEVKKRRTKKKKISKSFGLHTKEYSGVSYRYIFRINSMNRMSICGKVQYNPNNEILLMLHKNLATKYIMPSYEKLIRVNDVEALQAYIRYESQRDIYLLNDFKRLNTQ